MKFSRKFSRALAGLCLCLCLSTAAWAARPEEALSARPEDSAYLVLHLEDLGGFLRWALSEGNLRPLSLLSDGELDEVTLQLILATVAQIPSGPAALVLGKGPDGSQILQAALALEGEGSVGELLFGANNPLAPAADEMLKESGLVFERRDGLLLLGQTPEDVTASLAALEDEEKRLTLKRRFKDRDFAWLHADFKTLEAITRAQKDSKLTEEDYKVLREAFRAPMNLEVSFQSASDRFLVSLAMNLKELLAEKYASALKDVKPVEGGHIRLVGEGSPLFALGTSLSLDRIKESPGLTKLWDEAVKALAALEVSEEDVLGLVNGEFSFTVGGGSVPYEGFKVPSVYLTQTGKEGAASSLLTKLMKNGELDKYLLPVKAGIGTRMFQVDPSLSPISCLLGTAGDTFFLGLMEAASLSDVPSPKPGLEKLMKKKSTGTIYVDFIGIQERLTGEEGFLPLLTPLASVTGQGATLEVARDVLGAKLSIPSFSMWAETPETLFMEFALADVPPGEGLWAKLAKAALALAGSADSGGAE